VDHSLVSSLELPAHSWRRLSFALGTIAAVEAIVIVAVGIVFVAKPFAHHLQNAATREAQAAPLDLRGKTGPDTPAAKPTRTHAQTVVMVLNGNGQSGAAASTAGRLRGIGYHIGPVGNAQRMDYPKSVVMYKRGFRPEAVRMAHELRVQTVGPLDGIRANRLGRAGLVYIVGAS